MSMAYLAQPEQQQQLEWLDGGTLAILLDSAATNGQLMVGRFDVSEGEAPPYHQHTLEDEVFMLITGQALVWVDDEEHELKEGGIIFLPKGIPSARPAEPASHLVSCFLVSCFGRGGSADARPGPGAGALGPGRIW
jgi:quercetin dioxygenase-like cupin family protein